jgi:hypothetical protein
MRTYVYLILFLIGLIASISKRIRFEKGKEKYDEKYVTLYREHSTLIIILFLALCIERIITILNV